MRGLSATIKNCPSASRQGQSVVIIIIKTFGADVMEELGERLRSSKHLQYYCLQYFYIFRLI